MPETRFRQASGPATSWKAPVLRSLALVAVIACVAAAASTEDVRSLVNQAIAAFRAGETNRAVELSRQALERAPDNAEAQFTVARVADELRDFTNAIAGYDRALKLDPAASDILQWRGLANFKAGRVKESVTDFEAYLEKHPDRRAEHWQYGIALYYVSRFDDGRKLFEEHRTVNPEDVENAAWHFLCNARANGVEKARAELIPIRGDGRVPMKEVFNLFAGKGTEADVFAAADAGKETLRPSTWRNQRCYAHLYVGLYHEALGEVAKAKPHVEKSATEFAQPHYMGDVARVHWMHLQRSAK